MLASSNPSIALEQQLAWLRIAQSGAGEREIAAKAVPYYWDGELIPLLADAAKTLPIWTMQPEDFPTPYGFLWLAQPIFMREDVVPRNASEQDQESWTGSEGVYCRWIAWGPCEVSPLGPGPVISLLGSPGIRLFYDVVGGDHYLQAWHGPHPFEWAVGETRDFDKMKDYAYTYIRRIDQILFAALAFMKQRIAIPTRTRPARATRRRLPACDVEPVLQVIKLRRASHPAHHKPNDETESVDWQCRWLVGGHWRRQWYPKRNLHQPLWIAPYVKGPEDKPVRSPKKLFAVMR